MVKKIFLCSLMTLLFLSTAAFAQEKKFRLYGFADARLMGLFFQSDESSIYWTANAEGWQFRLEHVNLYGDWRPNNNIRFLTEVGFHWQPHGFMVEKGPIGLILNPANPDSMKDTATYQNETIAFSPDGDQPQASVTIQRGWVDLLLNQYANIRAGKYLTPVGIWNVDHGSPVLITVRQPYMVSLIPVFPRDQFGLMFHGGAYLGDADLNYKLFLGRPQSDSSTPMIESPKDISVGLNVKTVLPVLSHLEIGATLYTGMVKDFVVTGKTSFTSPSDGLLTNVEYGTHYLSKSREIAIGGDIKVKPISPLTLQAEVQYKKMEDQAGIAHPDSTESDIFGFYGLAAYKFRISDKFNVSPYGMYGMVTSDNAKSNPMPSLLRSEILDGISSVIGGLNFNFFTNYTFKAEYAYLLVEGGNALTQLGASEEQLKQHVWNFQVAVAF